MVAKLKRAIPFIAVLCLTGASSAHAQLDLEIVRRAPPRMPIGLVLPEKLSEFRSVLVQDLQWSGFFNPREISPEETADWDITLECAVQESGVAAKLSSGAPDETVFHRLFSSEPLNERLLAHTIAAAVIEELTGQPAVTLTRIVAARQAGSDKEIVLLDYDGGRIRPLTRDGSLNRHPRFSPDGSAIIYTSFLRYWPAVYHQEIRTGQRRIIASYPGMNTAAVFHPEKDMIALSLSRDGNPGEIYLLELADRRLERLTRSTSSDTSPVFMPCGTAIVFVSDRTGRPHIYHMDLETRNIRRLTFESHYNTSPTVSPDGRFVAYTASVGGQFHIRLVDIETGRDFLMTEGSGRREDPAFAPNSRHLVYVHTAGRSSNLRLLDIFTRDEYVITRDGGYSTPDWR